MFRYRQTLRNRGREQWGTGTGQGWGFFAGTSTATLKSTMDTLVFLCQHTCTMVLPRWGTGFSRAVLDAVMSSSDSTSTAESSGHSGKVRRWLLPDHERVMRRVGTSTQTGSDYWQIKCGLVSRWCLSHGCLFVSWNFFFSRFCVLNLLLSLTLSVSRSHDGPLLVFAISIAAFMSVIHFPISVSELQ